MKAKPRVADDIPFRLGILSTIDLNDQAPLSADEIHDARSDRLWPHKLHSVKRTRTESIPKALFRDRGISAQPSCVVSLCNFCATHEAAPLMPSLDHGQVG